MGGRGSSSGGGGATFGTKKDMKMIEDNNLWKNTTETYKLGDKEFLLDDEGNLIQKVEFFDGTAKYKGMDYKFYKNLSTSEKQRLKKDFYWNPQSETWRLKENSGIRFKPEGKFLQNSWRHVVSDLLPTAVDNYRKTNKNLPSHLKQLIDRFSSSHPQIKEKLYKKAVELLKRKGILNK